MARLGLYRGSLTLIKQQLRIIYFNNDRFEWQKVGKFWTRCLDLFTVYWREKNKNIYCKIFSFILHWAGEHGHTLTIKNEKGRIKTDLGKEDYSFGHWL